MTETTASKKTPADFPRLHDIDYFNERLCAAIERISAIRPYKLESLGAVDGQDILLLTPAEMDASKPNILSASGFHGDAPAGPWGIVEFLETADEETLKSVNHSFLPLVNPSGFSTARYLNHYSQNPDAGFILQPPDIEEIMPGNNRYPSKEGDILMQNFTRLLQLGREGFSVTSEGGAPAPGSFADLMRFWGAARVNTPTTAVQASARQRIEAQSELTKIFARASAGIKVLPPPPAVVEEELSEEVDEDNLTVDRAPGEFPLLHDIDHFNARLAAALERVNAIRPYERKVLGAVGGHDIVLLAPRDEDATKPSILAAGGFHGEEPAGPWGIVEFLEAASAEQLKSVNYSFIPLVNPTGFILAQRDNMYGENPNRGFLAIPPDIHQDEDNLYPSREGEILIKHLPELVRRAKDGFVSQHEDWRMNDAFVFVNELQPMPSPFAQTLLDAIERHFDLLDADGSNTGCHKGLWANDHDGSFESLMFAHGVPRIATFETPGLKSVRDRIACQRDLTAAFGDYTAKNHTPRPNIAQGIQPG